MSGDRKLNVEERPVRQIRDKVSMYALLNAGLLGNTLRTWPSADAVRGSGFRERLGLRYTGPTGRRWFRNQMTLDEAITEAAVWRSQGADPQYIIWSESTDPQTEIANCEVSWADGPIPGLLIRVNETKGHSCRTAMLAGDAKEIHGFAASQYLRSRLWPSSLDEVTELLELYPNHVMELTITSRAVGAARGRNHVVWEVRAY